MGVFEAMMVPMVIFLVIVAPIWLVLHYRSKNVAAKSLGAEEQATLDQLARVAEKMEDRLNTLEQILATEDPAWKEKAK
jgi:phage shock protein B